MKNWNIIKNWRSGNVITIDQIRFRQPPPLPHQITGVKALVNKRACYLGDKPRTMKSRQVIDAACILFEQRLIDIVVVVARISGRGVWGNAKVGQIKRWSWKPSRVFEYHAKQHDLWSDKNPELVWVVTNYDFIRNEKRLSEFLLRLGNYQRAFLVFDESQRLGNHTSQQSKAAMRLRWSKQVSRCVMLSGTPGGPHKQWSQFNILDHVFDKRYKSFTTFKWRFTEYGPRELRQKKVTRKNGEEKVVWQKIVHREIGWKNLDQLSKITAPYCLMRERKDCIGLRDVPVMSTFREVRLAKPTWKMYQELKREALLSLDSGEVYLSTNAGVRLMRLAQICSGHLGGFEEGEAVRNFSSEKIDWLVEELSEECLAQNVIVWCRWVEERKQVTQRLMAEQFTVHQIYGNQPKSERRISEMIFAEDAVRTLGRYAMVAQPQAGGDSLDMSAASDVYRMSSDYNWETFAQSNDRPLGPGQKADFVSATDVIATGPDGQRTIEHTILEAREENRNLERMTCAEWRTELLEE